MDEKEYAQYKNTIIVLRDRVDHAGCRPDEDENINRELQELMERLSASMTIAQMGKINTNVNLIQRDIRTYGDLRDLLGQMRGYRMSWADTKPVSIWDRIVDVIKTKQVKN